MADVLRKPWILPAIHNLIFPLPPSISSSSSPASSLSPLPPHAIVQLVMVDDASKNRAVVSDGTASISAWLSPQAVVELESKRDHANLYQMKGSLLEMQSFSFEFGPPGRGLALDACGSWAELFGPGKPELHMRIREIVFMGGDDLETLGPLSPVTDDAAVASVLDSTAWGLIAARLSSRQHAQLDLSALDQWLKGLSTPTSVLPSSGFLSSPAGSDQEENGNDDDEVWTPYCAPSTATASAAAAAATTTTTMATLVAPVIDQEQRPTRANALPTPTKSRPAPPTRPAFTQAGAEEEESTMPETSRPVPTQGADKDQPVFTQAHDADEDNINTVPPLPVIISHCGVAAKPEHDRHIFTQVHDDADEDIGPMAPPPPPSVPRHHSAEQDRPRRVFTQAHDDVDEDSGPVASTQQPRMIASTQIESPASPQRLVPEPSQRPVPPSPPPKPSSQRPVPSSPLPAPPPPPPPQTRRPVPSSPPPQRPSAQQHAPPSPPRASAQVTSTFAVVFSSSRPSISIDGECRVVWLSEGGEAQRAGVSLGDVVLEANGESGYDKVRVALASARLPVTVVFGRQAQSQTASASAHPLVGKTFVREFGKLKYSGMVVRPSSVANKVEVLYNDGFTEIVDARTVEALLDRVEPIRAVDLSQPAEFTADDDDRILDYAETNDLMEGDLPTDSRELWARAVHSEGFLARRFSPEDLVSRLRLLRAGAHDDDDDGGGDATGEEQVVVPPQPKFGPEDDRLILAYATKCAERELNLDLWAFAISPPHNFLGARFTPEQVAQRYAELKAGQHAPPPPPPAPGHAANKSPVRKKARLMPNLEFML